MKLRAPVLVAGFAIGLLGIAWLRLQGSGAGIAGTLAGFATPFYVALTIVAAILFIKAGLPVRSLGFRLTSRPLAVIAMAAIGLGILQISGELLEPFWERIFGSGRDLTRFAAVGGSVSQLAAVLALSWTVAAFGEELAFRILLMRGIAFALGDSRIAFAGALFIQAMVFGLAHAYQGPVGVAGTITSGLIYGSLTLAARGSIWPAALAHGFNNTIGLIEVYLGA